MSEMSDPQNGKPVEDLLAEAIEQYGDQVPSPMWLNEHLRWLELLVCMLYARAGQAAGNARQAISMLDELGLVETADLARLAAGPAGGQLALMRQVLERLGFAGQDAGAFLGQACALAHDVVARHEGRLQVYLRRQGERMLEALGEEFPSLGAGDEGLRQAFATWLQNALCLPVFLDTASSRRFCQAAGCTLDELYRAADELDVNAALLDDIMDLWAAEEQIWQA